MFLKTLTLKGFKSFAESTALELEPGITVVVGPNGSGKSNVVDAIGWVLGAQAPSAVRSQRMDDVIFAGTAKRPASGRAEVSLTIDNSAALLPVEFNEVTITRTLFRTGESEYAINGVPCRLLDVQDMLSDAGVGRQQHVIVSQGQIDAVLNARPEDRRLIIEEAAGVLKYRKRKERAERRLASTEANLTRLQDLLREVRRQLRPLERQAEAARRHGDVVAELSALRLFLSGREIAALRSRLETADRQRQEIERDEAACQRRLAEMDTEVLATESRLAAMGADDVGEALARCEALRERARGLSALLAERRRSIERDKAAFVDQAVIASLEADAARLATELQEVESEAAALVPRATELGAAEDALEADRAAFAGQWADGVPAPTGKAAEVRGELGALRASVERTTAEVGRLSVRLESLTDRAARLTHDAEAYRQAIHDADASERPIVEALDQAEAARAAAASELDHALEALRAAETERNAWIARGEALALALDQARARAGAQRLADVAGVVGTLLDVVEVDAGWEAAFEAAAGDAVAAVVIDGVPAGRAALAALRAGDVGGAVLALGSAAGGASEPVTVPSGASLVRQRVRSNRPGVGELLDRLLHGAIVVDRWEQALDVSVARPDLVVVTPDGDRFGRSGWRVGTGATGATGAALEEAELQVARAAADVAEAEQRHAAARHALTAASATVDGHSRTLDANDSRLTAAADALARVESERREVATETEALRRHVTELEARAEREGARVAELEAVLPGLEADDDDRVEQGRTMALARTRLEERSAAVAALRTDLEVRAAGLDERRDYLRRRHEEVERRLAGSVAEREVAESRRLETERTEIAVVRMTAVVTDRLALIEARLGDLRDRRRRQTDAARTVAAALDDVRRRRAAEERSLAELRERRSRSELERTETTVRLEAAIETLRRDLDVSPETAMASECPPLAEGTSAPARARELERDLRLMGPINPLALEEYDALLERHTFLEEQLDDVRSTRRDLAKVIKAVDDEIVSVFAAAFADVSSNFEHLFATLFPGGTGRLKLTDPGNMLDTGVEVEAKPSGKNVKKLSLLSGGERSLTALAFLFAVFRSRPSPFYVMDEVEAALDDVNLHRFLDLLAEFRAEAQLLIVSHQKRTMEAADVLYGVTMQPGGSSRVVSERVTAGA